MILPKVSPSRWNRLRSLSRIRQRTEHCNEARFEDLSSIKMADVRLMVLALEMSCASQSVCVIPVNWLRSLGGRGSVDSFNFKFEFINDYLYSSCRLIPTLFKI